MKYNDRIDTDMNETLYDGDVSSGIGLLKSYTPPQSNKSGKRNDMNMTVDNYYVNGYYCYINSYTGSFINNHNSIDYTKKRDKTSTNIYLWQNTGSLDGVNIDYMLPESTPNKKIQHVIK